MIMAIKIGGVTVIDDSKNFTVGGTLSANASVGTPGQVLQSTGTGVTWGAAPSSSVVTPIKTANYTADANDLVRANTTAAGFSVTLPASPVDGAVVSIMDTYSKFGTNALTVLPSAGTTVAADATSLILDINGSFVTLIYSSANTNWALEQTPNVIAGLPTQTGNAGKALTTDGTTATWTTPAPGMTTGKAIAMSLVFGG
jgi:hypothetical protein